ncbi:hypothetical protein T439DRAFT_349745 [Meredithblackwellia eburnea MCA 4105]
MDQQQQQGGQLRRTNTSTSNSPYRQEYTPPPPSYSFAPLPNTTPQPEQEQGEPVPDQTTTSTSNGTARLRNINDLNRKQCWVCFETEEGSTSSKKEWVHACRCSLVSHSDCLLRWVTSYQQTHTNPPHCPVCASPYVIQESRPAFLLWYQDLLQRWDRTSMVLALGGLGGSVWAASSVYACWAVRTWAGDEVAARLFVRQRWPLSYFVNLPLIPITLILSRTPLIDSLLPFLPLTLVLSSTSSMTPSTSLSSLSFTYPPSPALTLCLLPWLRILYLRARKSIFQSLLNTHSRFSGGLAGLMEELEADRPAGGGAGMIDVAGVRGEVVAEVEMNVNVPGQGENGEEAGEGEEQVENNRLRVGIPRFTSLVVGALLFPAVSSAAGSILFYLASRPSSRTHLLRKLLGVQAVLAFSSRSSASTASGISLLNWLKSLTSTPVASSNLVMDPVWLRNTIGGGLVLVIRDIFALLAGVLEQRRKESRRVIGRPFDPSLELDDAPSSSNAGGRRTTSSSGGRNASGRQAVVHNML